MSIKSSAVRMVGIGVLASQVFLFAGCTSPMCRKYSDFFDQPREEQYKEFAGYSVDEQYEIFLNSLRCTHPGDMGFLDLIAVKGEEAIPFLTERFETERDELDRMFVLSIFWDMSTMRYADLRRHPDLLNYLGQEVASMRSPYRESREKTLQDIKEANEERTQDEKLAAKGEEVMGLLQYWLDGARSEWQQFRFIWVFSYMSVNRYADLRDYPFVLDNLERVVASMKYPRYKAAAEKELQRIKDMNEKLNQEDAGK